MVYLVGGYLKILVLVNKKAVRALAKRLFSAIIVSTCRLGAVRAKVRSWRVQKPLTTRAISYSIRLGV